MTVADLMEEEASRLEARAREADERRSKTAHGAIAAHHAYTVVDGLRVTANGLRAAWHKLEQFDLEGSL